MNDWRGTPIKVGTRIVYPGRSSSYMWMNEGEVVSPELPLKVRRLYERHFGSTYPTQPKIVTILRSDMVTVVAE